jgi:iron complex outermembrane receptor protein
MKIGSSNRPVEELSTALASGTANDIVAKRNPTQAELDAIYNSGMLIPSSPINSSEVLAILTDAISNYGAVKVDGLDADMSYAFDNGLGRFNLDLSGTYLFRYELQRLAGEPFVDLLNTSSNPNQFRAHGSANWVNGPYRAGLRLNYVGEYTNSFDSKTIDPWITADLQFGYVFNEAPGLLRGLDVSLDIENITDEDPPFVNNGNEGSKIGYDPEAANARGRVISISLRKTW